MGVSRVQVEEGLAAELVADPDQSGTYDGDGGVVRSENCAKWKFDG